MIHKFSFNGDRLVLDVHSGSLHLVDEIVWDLLDDYQNLGRNELLARHARRYPLAEIEESLAEIELLVKEGVLFSPDSLEDSWEPPRDSVVKALCLNLAHDCNLRCLYCFGSQGDYHGPRELMSEETGKKAIDFLLASSGPRTHVEIDFFGGEPLLNQAVLQGLTAYGRQQAEILNKKMKFTATTNALLLNEKTGNYLAENQISMILSLDGRPQVHDRMRIHPGGKGSFQSVYGNVSRVLKAHPEVDYYIRGTFTRHNLDFAADVLYLADLGFDKISVEPAVITPVEGYALQEKDLPLLYAEYERLAKEMLQRAAKGRKIDFYHFNMDLEGGPCLPKRLTGCGAGHEYLAVTPSGDLYPCHQFAGRQDYWMGDVQRGIVRKDLQELFRQAHIYNKKGCRHCWAKFYCSGGCHANACAANNDIFIPHRLSCELMRKRLEGALYYQAFTKIN